MKRVLFVLILQILVFNAFSYEYKDVTTNVIYTYDPVNNKAEVKQGEMETFLDGDEADEQLGRSGSPDAKDEIAILDNFIVDGKKYIVDKIGDYAFVHMKNIKSVVIPSSVKVIGKESFAGCVSLSNVCFSEGLRSIEDRAFAGCHSFTTLSFPEGLESIGFEAFTCCSKLESISIPASLSHLGELPFYCCDSLSVISVANGNTKYDSRNNCNAIVETASNTLIVGCKETVMPSTITTLSTKAFALCKGLAKIDIPSSVKEIGELAFEGCSGLKRITLSEGLSVIRRGAFVDTDLSSITIPSSVQVIESGAFYSPSLQTLTSLIENPFEVQSICSQVQYQYVTLYVPQGAKKRYEETSDWNLFGSIVESQPTAITLLTTKGDSFFFNLQGHRLNAEPKHGVYIKNGKKVVK